jgi:uncharacterized membrane protein
MPALAAERVGVLFIVCWCLATFIYPTKMNKAYVLFINFTCVTALYSRMYLRLSTPSQMLAGMAIGIGEGMLFSLFFYFLRLHGYDNKIKNGLDLILNQKLSEQT